MKPARLLLSALIIFSLVHCKQQQHNKAKLLAKLSAAEQQLIQHDEEQANWQQLYTLLNENYVEVPEAERMRLGKFLEKYTDWPVGTLYTANEPGEKIIIKGHVLDEKKIPVANARLHVFQTDSHGYYTPLDSITHKMGEPYARLYTYIKTDSAGYFEIRTIRPGSYPQLYEGKKIPGHVHINITAAGYADKNLQAVFDDDPVMNSFWRDWAKFNGFPLLTLDHTMPGRIADLEINLKK
jgi:protocatechuate 3,4-dioxygenase beta subunit